MAVVEDDYRKITKLLGFNVLILPGKQDLGGLYADNLSTATMPETYVDDLSASGIMAIRHLLPSLEQKVRWVEEDRNIILVGVKGEVPIKGRAPKEPMLLPVPSGSAVSSRMISLPTGTPAMVRLRLPPKLACTSTPTV